MNRYSAIRAFGDTAFWIGMLLMAASLPLSQFGMSVSQFVIAGGWLLSGNPIEKFKSTFRQPVVWILWGIYFWLIIGLWNTNDFHFALQDLRIKLPLLLMPLFFSTATQLTARNYRILMIVFISATLVSTLVSLYIYLGLTSITVTDIRQIVIFISHIRLALMVCLCITCCGWFFFNVQKLSSKIGLGILVIWFVIFLFLLESLTGLSILFAELAVLVLFQMFNKRNAAIVRLSGAAAIVLAIICGVKLVQEIFIDSVKEIKVDVSKLPVYTALGHPYKYDTSKQEAENGNLVEMYLCLFEMDSIWKIRTGTSIFIANKNGREDQYALKRFLASKGLPRDASGVMLLNEKEIAAIKNGYGNVNDLKGNNIIKRVHDLAWEYRQYHFIGDPSGHSFTMRIEFWKNGWYIFKRNMLAGVGTGDIKEEYNKAYVERKSHLDKEFRYVSHNQYLRIAVLFGIPGLLYFLFALIAPSFFMHKQFNLLCFSFLFIVMCSMLTEDTLETQAGATFYAFFHSLFLFFPHKKKIPETHNF